MRRFKWFSVFVTAAIVLCISSVAIAAPAGPGDSLDSLVHVQKYARAIHIMGMLLVGFGFLMVFVKKYGRSAITATYLLVSIAIPMYFLKDSMGILGIRNTPIDALILAEFAAASLLIGAGAILGRLKMMQYLLLGLLFVPLYAFNEWLLLSGGLGLIKAGIFVDTGGSIVIHSFGALFGLGAIFSLTTKKEFDLPVESDETSDRFSLLGSMVLWMFWPSFCAALVPAADVPKTAINVILALCGSTLATYFTSLAFRKKVVVADIANAALAGGVAIGATCNHTSFGIAFVIGLIAGFISVFGYAVIQERLQRVIKKIDTCGVLYLHGLPGLFGGIAAIFVVQGIQGGAEAKGIGITIVLALVSGLVVGKILSLFGGVAEPYADSDELDVA